MPFDWKDPQLYLVAIGIIFSCSYCILLTSASMICYVVGSCSTLLAFLNDLKQKLNTLNATGEGFLTWNHMELKEKVSEFVKFHATVKELSITFHDYLQTVSIRKYSN